MKRKIHLCLLFLFLGIVFTIIFVFGLKIYLKHDSFLFATIGDYGIDRRGHAEDVAGLVKSWSPDFIVTLGDNNYREKPTGTYDYNVGRLYADYIYPYQGQYGGGSSDGVNRFWPSIGNHDAFDGPLVNYLKYFTLPNNERYYDIRIGEVHIFCLNTYSEPDGYDVDSVQAEWLKDRVAASAAPWKLVVAHSPPYSSGKFGGNKKLRWPFSKWGVSAVLSGHLHFYERLEVNNIPYFINGLGGNRRYPTVKISDHSISRYNDDYGAMQVSGNKVRISFKLFNIKHQLIDRLDVVKNKYWHWIRDL